MTNSDRSNVDAQSNNQSLGSRFSDIEYARLAKLAAAAIIGLAVNAAVVSLFMAGGLMGIADGVAWLAPASVLGAWAYDRYNPVDIRYVNGVVLFLTLLLANTVSIVVKVFRQGLGADAVLGFVLLAIVAAFFTPGPFLAVWATRRWALEPTTGGREVSGA